MKGFEPISLHAYTLPVVIVTCFEELTGCSYTTFGFVGPLTLSSRNLLWSFELRVYEFGKEGFAASRLNTA